MLNDWLPPPLEVIRRHPTLAPELARRLTSARLPAPDETVVHLTEETHRLRIGGETPETVRARVYRRADWDAGEDFAAVNVTICETVPGCQLICQPGTAADDFTEIGPDSHAQFANIGPGSGARLRDGGPWMAIFAAVAGAADLVSQEGRRMALAAIDATGCGPGGRRVLTTLVLRAGSGQARQRLEAESGPGGFAEYMFGQAYADGFARGLQRGRTEAAIVQVLTERDLGLTDAQHAQISACDDTERLARWLSRALTAATAADALAA